MTPGPDDTDRQPDTVDPDTVDLDTIDSAETAAGLLYGLDAGAFVAARDQLVRSLRAAKRRELAAEVKALRRPSVIAAELNRALRRAPAERETLMAAAGDLARGHHRLLAGDPVDLAQLQAAHRAAVAAVAAHTEAHRAEVHAALEAASLDETLHGQLRSATFAAEPAPVRGFDLLAQAGLAAGPRLRAVPSPATPPSPRPVRPRSPARRATDTTTARRVDTEPVDTEPVDTEPVDTEPVDQQARLRAGAARQAAERARAQARRRVEATRVTRDRAELRVTDLEARLTEARAHQIEAERRLAEAEVALIRAEADLARTEPDTDTDTDRREP